MPFMPFKDSELFYTIQDATTASRNTGLTCFMIHGLGSSNAFYAPIIPQLTSAGIRCIAADTEGSGLSPWMGQLHHGVRQVAAGLRAIMEYLQIDLKSVVLVGHSMGGMLACEMAAERQYAGVVLLGPVHPSPAVSEAFVDRIEVVREKGMEPMADKIPSLATGSRATALHRAFIRALLLSQDPKGYVFGCNLIAHAEAPEYSRIDCPILFLAGADDQTSPIENVLKIHDACPTVEAFKKVVTLEGVGHWHVIEAADAVGSHISSFVQKIAQVT